MEIKDVPFNTIKCEDMIPSEHPGKTGRALWRTLEIGNILVRMVEYSPGYSADHWCNCGHVLLVLDGELHTELSDGRRFTLTPGMSYQLAEDANPHRSSNEIGARLFIVD
jgi:hypothetical protein